MGKCVSKLSSKHHDRDPYVVTKSAMSQHIRRNSHFNSSQRSSIDKDSSSKSNYDTKSNNGGKNSNQTGISLISPESRIHYYPMEDDYEIMGGKVIGSGYSGPIRLATKRRGRCKHIPLAPVADDDISPLPDISRNDSAQSTDWENDSPFLSNYPPFDSNIQPNGNHQMSVNSRLMVTESMDEADEKPLYFAVKSFNKRALNDKKLNFLKNEVLIYLSLDHPHITRLHDVYENTEYVHLIMDYCSGKELYHRLLDQKVYNEKIASKTTFQMLLAISYLHSRNIVHRDLKLENFLYENDSADAKLKLIDFGFSRVWRPNTQKMHQSCGSIAYVAPEVLGGSYTEKCDMWSLGVITFMLLSGTPPFYGNEDKILSRIEMCQWTFRPDKWSKVSKVAMDFVSRLLVLDPERRMSARQALSHEWIRMNSRNYASSLNLYSLGTTVSPSLDGSILNSLRNFAIGSKLKRAALTMMAYSLTSDEIQDFYDIFCELDEEQTGTIKLVTLCDIMKQKMRYTSSEIDSIFNKIDPTHEGEIEYTEFIAAIMSARLRLHKDLVYAAFRKFDVDNTGQISVDNLRQLYGDSFEGGDIQEILEEVDLNHDGFIDYHEFVEIVVNNARVGGNADDQKATHSMSRLDDQSLSIPSSRNKLDGDYSSIDEVIFVNDEKDGEKDRAGHEETPDSRDCGSLPLPSMAEGSVNRPHSVTSGSGKSRCVSGTLDESSVLFRTTSLIDQGMF